MPLTDEERELAYKSIYLDMLCIVIELDITQYDKMKFPSAYMKLAEKMLSNVSLELRKVKKEMYDNGMKVHEKERYETSTKFQIFCRGYEEEFSPTNMQVKSQVEQLFHEFMFKHV